MALSSDSVTSTAARSSPGNLITQVSPKLSVDQNSSNATTLPTVQETKAFMIDHSTPPASVSSFCRAVLHRLLPKDLFGSGSAGCRNQDSVMKHVDRFISLRRFETLSLHEVCQGLKVSAAEVKVWTRISLTFWLDHWHTMADTSHIASHRSAGADRQLEKT